MSRKSTMFFGAIALALTAPLCVSAHATAIAPSPTPIANYSDVPDNHWAKANISRCVENGWFAGYPDRTFHPDASITRAEAMKVFVVFTGLDAPPVTEASYSDVKAGEWHAPYIEAGKGLLPAKPANGGKEAFMPGTPITREDTVFALVVALGYDSLIDGADTSALGAFKDQNSVPSDIKPYMKVALDKKLVAGYEDGTIRGKGLLTRAEFATLLYRASDIGFSADGGFKGRTAAVGTAPSAVSNPAPTTEVIQEPPALASGATAPTPIGSKAEGGGGVDQVKALEKAVFELVNAERVKAGASSLIWSDGLADIARKHSKDMAERDFFDHTNPDGQSPFDRIKAMGVKYRNAAENIAAGEGTPEGVMGLWMNSPNHKSNILGNYSEIGVGLAYSSSGVAYWTQDFILM